MMMSTSSSFSYLLVLAMLALVMVDSFIIQERSSSSSSSRPFSFSSQQSWQSRRMKPNMGLMNMGLSDLIEGIDNYKEESRKYRGRSSSFSDASQWRKHRSSNRYFHAVATSSKSGVLLGLVLEVATVVFIAIAVCAWNHIGQSDWGDVGGLGTKDIGFATQHRAEIDPFLLTLTSPALGLLLVFRTNSAYARWWEARTILGGVVNRSRDIIRHALIWFDRSDGDVATQEYIKEVCSFAVALKHHLRLPDSSGGIFQAKKNRISAKKALIADLQDLSLPASSIKAIANAPNPPLEVIRRLSRGTRINVDNILQKRDWADSQSINGYGGSGERVADSVVRALDRNIGDLVDQLGACERIAKTPMPLVYTRHTERFLSLWLATIPFALANTLSDGTSSHTDLTIVLGTAFISFFFLGIDELGIQIEEPFSVLPMDSICAAIKSSAAALIQCEMGENDMDEEEEEEEDVYGEDVAVIAAVNLLQQADKNIF